ncbi:MAG: hypothetical protein R2825_02045 [Saprospiraceae bacterium]
MPLPSYELDRLTQDFVREMDEAKVDDRFWGASGVYAERDQPVSATARRLSTCQKLRSARWLANWVWRSFLIE